ncbi:MAG: hypothetical protein IT580_03225 [Verrucomicrobiales bacterium]|jgi:hypothetical protein|nr:hypothetical protein [Verrucomicrobiales bacterium]
MTTHRKPKSATSVLALAFGPSRVEGIEIRRSNGSVTLRHAFAQDLALPLLGPEPELVGRDLRKLLDTAGVRERACTVCLPSSWVLSLQVALPPLQGADLESFLQLEAERGFPYPPEDLLVAQSLFQTAAGASFAELLAVPRESVHRLEAVLAAARLRPLTLSLATAALHPPADARQESALTILHEGSHVALQVTHGGGIALLRTIEVGDASPDAPLGHDPETFLRDLRITLGQLPPELRDAIRRARVYGRDEPARAIADLLHRKAEAWNLRVESVRDYAPAEFPVKVPTGTAVTPALSLGLRHLTGTATPIEFLPPRLSAWQRLRARFANRRLGWFGVPVAAAAALVIAAFLIQQIQLWHWNNRWNAIATQAQQLDQIQQNIRRFRPWFDESQKSLSILRRLTEAFPEDNSLSAKSFELRPPATIVCSGVARDRQALLQALDKLRASSQVSDLKVEQMRGKTPLEFTFHFQWGDPPAP